MGGGSTPVVVGHRDRGKFDGDDMSRRNQLSRIGAVLVPTGFQDGLVRLHGVDQVPREHQRKRTPLFGVAVRSELPGTNSIAILLGATLTSRSPSAAERSVHQSSRLWAKLVQREGVRQNDDRTGRNEPAWLRRLGYARPANPSEALGCSREHNLAVKPHATFISQPPVGILPNYQAQRIRSYR